MVRDHVTAVLRGAATLLFFLFFGLGAVAVSPLMLLLRSPRRCQPVVRALWIPFVALLRLSGIIGVRRGTLPPAAGGCVIAANHPSLIDVVLVLALVPRTLYVAKRALWRHPFLAAVVRHTSLPVDERLPDAARPYLRDGWNLLVFPEGTRSPAGGGLQPFHRGVAQLVLRTGAPLVCLGIRTTRRIVGKNQKPWDVGARRVVYSLRADAPTRHAAPDACALRPAAVRLTGQIRRRIETLLARGDERPAA
jgi:1-acyl-sn-glycerol-3-phosphate acyltransferase